MCAQGFSLGCTLQHVQLQYFLRPCLGCAGWLPAKEISGPPGSDSLCEVRRKRYGPPKNCLPQVQHLSRQNRGRCIASYTAYGRHLGALGARSLEPESGEQG